MFTLYLVATLSPGIVSYQPVEVNKPYSTCSDLARVYQRQEGNRGSFACMPDGWSIVGLPVASR